MAKPAARRQIVALGGGGAAEETARRLDDFVLSLAGRRSPRVCFLGTAGGDADAQVASFYARFAPPRARASHLSVFPWPSADPMRHLSSQDVIYVGGGNTANLLALWRLHGVDTALREAYSRGVVLAGPSAGGLCWFQGGVTDSFGPQLAALNDGLGLLGGSFCPHYDGQELRRPVFRRLVAAGSLPDGYAADDGVGLHFVEGELSEVVSALPGSTGYRLERVGGRVRERALSARLLT